MSIEKRNNLDLGGVYKVAVHDMVKDEEVKCRLGVGENTSVGAERMYL